VSHRTDEQLARHAAVLIIRLVSSIYTRVFYSQVSFRKAACCHRLTSWAGVFSADTGVNTRGRLGMHYMCCSRPTAYYYRTAVMGISKLKAVN